MAVLVGKAHGAVAAHAAACGALHRRTFRGGVESVVADVLWPRLRRGLPDKSYISIWPPSLSDMRVVPHSSATCMIGSCCNPDHLRVARNAIALGKTATAESRILQDDDALTVITRTPSSAVLTCMVLRVCSDSWLRMPSILPTSPRRRSTGQGRWRRRWSAGPVGGSDPQQSCDCHCLSCPVSCPFSLAGYRLRALLLPALSARKLPTSSLAWSSMDDSRGPRRPGFLTLVCGRDTCGVYMFELGEN